ncbi:response regulator, partial [bacterium]|nr:response regulator [bacterium]
KEIDLVLMDIQLPDISGYEVTKQLKIINKDIPVIAQTAFALEGDKEKSLEAGCDDYITKPIKAKKLLSLIDKYLK